MSRYTKLIDSHNLQLKKIVDFSVNYTYLIPNLPPSQGRKNSDTLVAAPERRSGKLRMFGQLHLHAPGQTSKQATRLLKAEVRRIGPSRKPIEKFSQ
ncbi:hypothetical protein QT971_08830 [Microcoleus sp. herbarium19]